jgi:hypothetical protein
MPADDRDTIECITDRLEKRLVVRLVDAIRPLLSCRSAEVQAAVLTALAAEFPRAGAEQPLEATDS